VSNEHVKTHLLEFWLNGQWVNHYRDNYTYNSNGNINTILSEIWNKNQWENGSRDIYAYNPNGDILSLSTEKWQYGKWADSIRCTNSYNPDGNPIDVLSEKLDGTKWINTDSELGIKDSTGREYSFIGYKIEISYWGEIAQKEEIGNTSFSLNCYPNPATEIINFNYILTEPQIVSLSINNSSGIELTRINNLLMQVTGNYCLYYDAGNLAPGVYFLTIRAGKNIETKKFVVVR
jgi:hypothetical protein